MLYAKQLFAYAQFQWKIEDDSAWDLIYKTLYKIADVFSSKEINTDKELKAYIFRTFINYIKNHKRDFNRKMDGAQIISIHENLKENQIEQTPISKELQLVQQYLEDLESWKRILLLLRSQGMPYSDITRYVDKPENQLKVYYGRLKSQMADKLAKLKREQHGN